MLNTLIGSLFVNQLTAILQLQESQIREIEKLFREFIWGKRSAKIALITLKKKKEQGGLKFIDFRAKQDTIKISWIFKAVGNEEMEIMMYENLDKELGRKIWECNLREDDVNKLFAERFWQDVLAAWCKFNYEQIDPEDTQAILNQTLWYNSDLRIEDRPIVWYAWVRKGIHKVQDILIKDRQGNIIFKNHNDLKVNWLELQAVQTAIPRRWKETLFVNDQNGSNDNFEVRESCSKFDKLSSIHKQSALIYNQLIDDALGVAKYVE